MVAIILCAETRAALEKAGLREAIAITGAVATAPHGAMLRAGLSLTGKEVHLCHADAAAAHAPPPTRDPELERRVAALRARAADSEYARMVRDVARGGGDGGGAAASRALREATPHASLALNVVATMATCFAAAYFLVRASTGSRSLALGAGAVGLAIALAVEVTLILTRIYALDRAAEEKVARHHKAIDRRAARSANPEEVPSLGPLKALSAPEMPQQPHRELAPSEKKKQ